MLGHIVRLPTEDPMTQTSLRRNKPLFPAAKRVGRPKLNWAKETYNNAWTTAKAIDPNTPGIEFKATAEQYNYLINKAELRLPPFDTKNSKNPNDVEAEPMSPPINHLAGSEDPPINHLAVHANPPLTRSTPTTSAARLGHVAAAAAVTPAPAERPPLKLQTELQNRPLSERFRAGPALQVRWAGSEPTTPPTDSTSTRAHGQLSLPAAKKKCDSCCMAARGSTRDPRDSPAIRRQSRKSCRGSSLRLALRDEAGTLLLRTNTFFGGGN